MHDSIEQAGRRCRVQARRTALLVTVLATGLVWAADYPARREGFWKSNITSGEGAEPITAEYCVDAASDKRLMAHSNSFKGKQKDCTSTELRQERGSYVMVTTCTEKDAVVVVRAEVKGDFKSRIVSTITATRTPPEKEKPAPAPIVNTAVWSGACPADWKPGEISMNGSPRVDVALLMDVGNKVAEVAGKVTDAATQVADKLKGLFGRGAKPD